MRRPALPFAAIVLILLLATLPARAQQADTTVTDPTATDTLQAPADSVGAGPADPDRVALRKKRARRAARAAAERWLALIDEGDFEGSWTAADSTLRAGISQEDWADQGIRARAWLDTLHTRRLQRVQYRDSTTRLPGGHPVVILQYASEYAKGRAREAVITTRRDTAWAVAGYRVVSARGDSLRADTTQAPASP